MKALEGWLDQHRDKLVEHGEIEFHGGTVRWTSDEIRVEPVAMEGFRLTESIPGTFNLYRTRSRPEGLGVFAGRGASEWLMIELRDPRGHAIRLSCSFPTEPELPELAVSGESSSAAEKDDVLALLQTARLLGVESGQFNVSALKEEEQRHVVGSSLERTDRTLKETRSGESKNRKEADSDGEVVGQLHHLSREKQEGWLSSKWAWILSLGLIVGILMSPGWMPASCCMALTGGDWEVRAVGTAGDYLVIGAGDSVGNVTMYLVAAVDLRTGELVETESWRSPVSLEGTGPDFVWVREIGEQPVALSVPELEEIYDIEDDLYDEKPELQDLVESIEFSDDGMAVIDARDGNYYLVDPRSGDVTSQSTRVQSADRSEPGSCRLYGSPPERIGDWRLFEGKRLCDWTGNSVSLVEFRSLEGGDSKLRVGWLNEEENQFRWVKKESEWLDGRDDDEAGRKVRWSGTVDGNVVLVMDDGRDFDDIHVLAVSEADGEPVWNVTID